MQQVMFDRCLMTTYLRVLTLLPGIGLSISRSLRLQRETYVKENLKQILIFVN